MRKVAYLGVFKRSLDRFLSREEVIMNINPDKIQNSVIIFLRATIFLAIAGAGINKRWALFFSSTLVLSLTFLPYFITKEYKINLPVEFEFGIILFIYASLFLGELHDYYIKYWWWDILLHTGSGIALGFAGFLILYVLYYQNKIKAKPIWIAIFAFCFAVAIGSLWEIFEFTMDYMFGFNMQKTGLTDTMWDLIVDSIGAALTSAIGYYYIKGEKTPLFTRLLVELSKENRKYFKVKNKNKRQNDL